MKTAEEHQIVQIRPEVQDPGDDQFTWVVLEDRDTRVLVRPLGTGMVIAPSKCILKSDLVGFGAASQ